MDWTSLIEYGTEPFPDPTQVVNPASRRQDREIFRQKAVLVVREHGQFGALQLADQSDPQEASDFELLEGQLLKRIEQQQKALDELKRVRKETPKPVMLKNLPEAQRFTQLRTSCKHFVDTIKLIAYPAESALVRAAREKLQQEDDARALLRQIFGTALDLQPDLATKTLAVRLHCLSTEAHQAVLEHVCGELNATETTFPGTALRLVFAPVRTTEIPRGQDP